LTGLWQEPHHQPTRTKMHTQRRTRL
jgi:hypothetical protein